MGTIAVYQRGPIDRIMAFSVAGVSMPVFHRPAADAAPGLQVALLRSSDVVTAVDGAGPASRGAAGLTLAFIFVGPVARGRAPPCSTC
jgi:hypothetical protein